MLQSLVLDFLQLLLPSLEERGEEIFPENILLIVGTTGPAAPGGPASVDGNSLGHRLPLGPEPLGIDAGVAVELDAGHVGLAGDLGRFVGATSLAKQSRSVSINDRDPVILTGSVRLQGEVCEENFYDLTRSYFDGVGLVLVVRVVVGVAGGGHQVVPVAVAIHFLNNLINTTLRL